MHPELIRIGNFVLPTYGFLIVVGLIIALYVTFRIARQQGLDPDDVWNLGTLVIFAGIIGAKVLMIAVDWDYYSRNPGQIFSLGTLRAGGVFSGGLLVAIVAAIWYMRKHHMPMLRTCDVFAPGVALGHVFGRWGCFFAGCCWGKETHAPWAVTFTNPVADQLVGTPLGISLHPTQLYEMIVELINFIILYWMVKHKKFEGQVIGGYMFLYGFARFFLEFLRGDPGRGELFGGLLTGTQAIAIILVIAGGVLWLRRVPLQQTVPMRAAGSR